MGARKKAHGLPQELVETVEIPDVAREDDPPKLQRLEI